MMDVYVSIREWAFGIMLILFCEFLSCIPGVKFHQKFKKSIIFLDVELRNYFLKLIFANTFLFDLKFLHSWKIFEKPKEN